MIAIYGQVTATNGQIFVNDVATALTVSGNIGQRMTYDKETGYTFVYGAIENNHVALYSRMVWDGNTKVIIPVRKGESVYSGDRVDVENVGCSDECLIIMVDANKTEYIGIGNDKYMVVHDLQTSMVDYHSKWQFGEKIAV